MRLTILFILISTLAQSQDVFVKDSRFDNLLIAEEHNNNFQIIYGRIYKVAIQDSIKQLVLFSEYKMPDSLFGVYDIYNKWYPNFNQIRDSVVNDTLKIIQEDEYQELVRLINNPKSSYKEVLNHYGIDRAWYDSNKTRLFNQLISQYAITDELKLEFARELLFDYESFVSLVYTTIHRSGTSRYSNVTIAFENQFDTLMIHTRGVNAFMVPWESDSAYKNYDPKLSIAIHNIIPEELSINKNLDVDLTRFEAAILRELEFHIPSRKRLKKQSKDKADNNK